MIKFYIYLFWYVKIPKSGYIDVQDYESPRKLAEYMRYLDSNRTAYNSYFKWKRHVIFESLPFHHIPFCSMCIQLHLEEHVGLKRKILHNFSQLWDVGKQCKLPVYKKNESFYFWPGEIVRFVINEYFYDFVPPF